MITDMDARLAPFPREDGHQGSPRSVYQHPNKPALTTIEPTTRKSIADESMTSISSSATNRRIRFHEQELLTSTIEVERCDPEQKEKLFYNKSDFARFQQDEQRRYDRMMMKKMQKMVQEQMSDQIAHARDQGATEEDIEAMMPQTPEEIFALLGMAGTGGVMPQAPQNMALNEQLLIHHIPVEPAPAHVVVAAVEKELEPDYLDEDIYTMFGVKDHPTSDIEVMVPIFARAPRPEEGESEAMVPVPPAGLAAASEEEQQQPEASESSADAILVELEYNILSAHKERS
jgi:hypothetical protein